MSRTPNPLHATRRAQEPRKLQCAQGFILLAPKSYEETLSIGMQAKAVLDGTTVDPRRIDPSGQRARLLHAQRAYWWAKARLRPAYRTRGLDNVWWVSLRDTVRALKRLAPDPSLLPNILQLFPVLLPVWCSPAEESSGERMPPTEE